MRKWLLTIAVVLWFSVIGAHVRETLTPVWVLLVHRADKTTFVSDSYGTEALALREARTFRDRPDTWVIVSPSTLHTIDDDRRGPKGDRLSQLLGLVAPTLHAQILNISVTAILPVSLRSGHFVSPAVLAPPGVQEIRFVMPIPNDADWFDATQEISMVVHESLDGGQTHVEGQQCSILANNASHSFGFGRPHDRSGNPVSGVNLSCGSLVGGRWYDFTSDILNVVQISAEAQVR